LGERRVLSSKKILMSAMGDAAICLGFTEIGTFESDTWADFIAVSDDPMADISNMRSIDAVYISGNRVPDET
jgi:imidazolonepropionase-like amidohydrolase